MKNPLDSIKGTIIAGIILSAVILYVLMSSPSSFYLGFMRFFHVIAGVAWIGLLYYFNFVQTEYFKEADSLVDFNKRSLT